jgi:hypothetical protein
MHSLTVAFATARHARDALSFLRVSGMRIASGHVSGGSGAEFATVELLVDRADRARVLTLLSGLHAIVLEDRAQVAVA